MKEYTKTNPVYSPKIKVVETTDPAHADNVNAAPKQLLENTMANRQSIERLEATTGIAEGDYNAGNAYHTGDFCLYDNNLYKCIKDTTGAWDAGSWKETSPLEEIESLRKSLDALDTLMGGATQSKEGTAGLVPAPAAGEQGKYLKGDGTWGTPPDTVYEHPTTAGNNHIPAGGAAGKFLKWLRDGVAEWASLGAAAFASLANNLSTTEPGFAMDARMGPVIDTRFVDMETQIEELNSALGVNENLSITGNCKLVVNGRIACLLLNSQPLTSNGIIQLNDIPDEYISSLVANISYVQVSIDGKRYIGYVSPANTKKFNVYYYNALPGGASVPAPATVLGTVFWFY